MNFIVGTFVLQLCVLSTLAVWVKEMENKGAYEGDMVLDPDEYEPGWNISRHGHGTYASIRGGRWPNGVVPYVITSSIGARGVQAIYAAIANYHRYTCIRWKQRTNERTYVSFYRGGGCSSPVGYRYGRVNTISLATGCWHTGVTMHEMGHTLGFYHEQSRPDRDANVRIIWGNIMRGMGFNFNKMTTRDIDSLGTPYDFGSMMHYGSTAFGIGNRMTIQTVDPRNQRLIGNRNGFSPIDIKQLKLMYKCGTVEKTEPPRPTEPATEGPMTRPAICDNQKLHCLAWAHQGYCKGEFERYMNKYCCKACEDQAKVPTTPGVVVSTAKPTQGPVTTEGPIATEGPVTTGPVATPVTAGTLGPSLTSVPPPPECDNKYGFCVKWAQMGWCHGEHMAFMVKNCCRACMDLLKPKTTVPPRPKTEAPRECVDTNENCPSWAASGECEKNPDWMKTNCRKSCHVC